MGVFRGYNCYIYGYIHVIFTYFVSYFYLVLIILSAKDVPEFVLAQIVKYISWRELSALQSTNKLWNTLLGKVREGEEKEEK